MDLWTPTVRLEATDLDTLYLDPADGWFPQRLDTGFPIARENVEDAPDDDGTHDLTQYHGARNITLVTHVDASVTGTTRLAMERQLKRFLHPARRSTIIGILEPYDTDTLEVADVEQRIIVRGARWTDGGVHLRQNDEITAQWVCPSGRIELNQLQTVEAFAGGEAPQTGLTFPATPDFTFGGATQASGGAVADNVGDVAVWPVITMFGPASGTPFELRNSSTGDSMFFTGLSIAAGDWIRIDGAAKTIRNSTGTDYYDTLVPPPSWIKLRVGENRIYMLPTIKTAPPASVRIEWRPAWL